MSPEGVALMAEMYADNELNAEAIMEHVREQTMHALAAPLVPYTDQLACARVQLRLAQRVYAVETQRGTTTAAWATHQRACQQAIIHTLTRLVALYEPPAQESLL